MALIYTLAVNAFVFAQIQKAPGDSPLFIGGGSVLPNGEPDLTGILVAEHHRDELEVDPEQAAKIQAAIEQTAQENHALTQLIFGTGIADVSQIQKTLNDHTHKLAVEIKSYLYPEQIIAAQQIAVSQYIRAYGISGFAKSVVASELDLSQEEIKSIQDKATKIEMEYKKKVAELQKQARTELVNAFPVGKRKKLLDLFQIKQPTEDHRSKQ